MRGWEVTCRSSRGSPSAAGRAEPGSPSLTLDTWSQPHLFRPAGFFTVGKFWKKSKIREGKRVVVKKDQPGSARRLWDHKGLGDCLGSGYRGAPQQRDRLTDRQTGRQQAGRPMGSGGTGEQVTTVRRVSTLHHCTFPPYMSWGSFHTSPAVVLKLQV